MTICACITCYIAKFYCRWLPFTCFFGAIHTYFRFQLYWIVALNLVLVDQLNAAYLSCTVHLLSEFTFFEVSVILFQSTHVFGAVYKLYWWRFVNCDFKWIIYTYIIFIDYEELKFLKMILCLDFLPYNLLYISTK